MKKLMLLALVGALILPLATRAESGSGKSGVSLFDKLRLDNKTKISDDKGFDDKRGRGEMEQRGREAEGELPRGLDGNTDGLKAIQVRGEKLDWVKEFRQQMQEKRGTRIQNYIQMASKRLGYVVEKLEKLAQNTDERLSRWASQGINTDPVKIQLEKLKTATAEARKSVDGLPNALSTYTGADTLSAADAQKVREIVQQTATVVKTAASQVPDLIKLIRETMASNVKNTSTDSN